MLIVISLSESSAVGEIPIVAKILWSLGFVLAGGSFCLWVISFLIWLVLRLFSQLSFFENPVLERLFFLGAMGLVASAFILLLGLLIYSSGVN